MLSAEALPVGRIVQRSAVSDLFDVVSEHAPLNAITPWPLTAPAGARDYTLAPTLIFRRVVDRRRLLRWRLHRLRVDRRDARTHHREPRAALHVGAFGGRWARIYT